MQPCRPARLDFDTVSDEVLSTLPRRCQFCNESVQVVLTGSLPDAGGVEIFYSISGPIVRCERVFSGYNPGQQPNVS